MSVALPDLERLMLLFLKCKPEAVKHNNLNFFPYIALYYQFLIVFLAFRMFNVHYTIALKTFNTCFYFPVMKRPISTLNGYTPVSSFKLQLLSQFLQFL